MTESRQAHSWREKMQKAYIHHQKLTMPRWLEPKLGFLRKHALNDKAFYQRVAEVFPPSDDRYKLIQKADRVAAKAFRKISRDGGGPYFEHLRSSALIALVHLRVRDADVIAALLLHDMIEDIRSWNSQRLAREFNENIASLVWWVSKPKSRRFRTPEEVDRKAHRNLAAAPRKAVLIKLCDRLHNLMCMWNLDPHRVSRKINETRDFILPLAEKHTILIHEIEDMLRMLERPRT